MPVLATNKCAGDYGVPGAGVFRPGETKEVPPAVASRLAFRNEFVLEYTDPAELPFRDTTGKPAYLGFMGALDATFGYGGGSILIARALTQLGVELRHNPILGVNYNDLPKELRPQLKPRKYMPRIELVHALPENTLQAHSPVVINWTMWETSHLPDNDKHKMGNWVSKLNKTDCIVVPCNHNKDVFEASGVTRPIDVIPYGMDIDVWPYFERPERDTFTVVQFGDLSSRKGVMEAVEAFQLAFPREKDARLILKTARGRFATGTFGIPTFRDWRITVIDALWSRQQLVQFMHSADCGIWLSRGEGFGLPPLQMALTGLPVVMTTVTGMADYYLPQFFYGVRQAGTRPAPLGGDWYEPDVTHAAEQLRAVYDNRKAALKRAKASSTYVRNKFNLTAFAQRIGAYLEKF